VPVAAATPDSATLPPVPAKLPPQLSQPPPQRVAAPRAAVSESLKHQNTTVKVPPTDPTKEIAGTRTEHRVKMNRMRLRIAQRLKDAQNTNAMLTTFNEIDMR